MTPIRAPRGRVVFVRELGEAESDGGIAIPDRAQRPSVWGMVVDVGDGVEEVEVGDRVIVDLWQGFEVTWGGVAYWVIDQDRVLARQALAKE